MAHITFFPTDIFPKYNLTRNCDLRFYFYFMGVKRMKKLRKSNFQVKNFIVERNFFTQGRENKDLWLEFYLHRVEKKI